jgi:hypothetical protein
LNMKMPKENAKTHHKHSPLTLTSDGMKRECRDKTLVICRTLESQSGVNQGTIWRSVNYLCVSKSTNQTAQWTDAQDPTLANNHLFSNILKMSGQEMPPKVMTKDGNAPTLAAIWGHVYFGQTL